MEHQRKLKERTAEKEEVQQLFDKEVETMDNLLYTNKHFMQKAKMGEKMVKDLQVSDRGKRHNRCVWFKMDFLKKLRTCSD